MPQIADRPDPTHTARRTRRAHPRPPRLRGPAGLRTGRTAPGHPSGRPPHAPSRPAQRGVGDALREHGVWDRGAGSRKAEPADKPGSVVDSHSSRPRVATRLQQPTRTRRGPRHDVPIWSCSRWGLPCPAALAPQAVRSYRTLSPSPRAPGGAVRLSALCCTVRRLAPPRRYLAPCPVEPGLSSMPEHRDCLADSARGVYAIGPGPRAARPERPARVARGPAPRGWRGRVPAATLRALPTGSSRLHVAHPAPSGCRSTHLVGRPWPARAAHRGIGKTAG